MNSSTPKVSAVMKAILIARVSTEESAGAKAMADRTKKASNLSPAQVIRLEGYCQNKGFAIIKTCSFGESAYSDNCNKKE